MIKNLIFDIGNVLVDFDWKTYLRSYGFPAEKERSIAKALFLNPQWNELDRGIKSWEEMEQVFAAQAPEYAADIRLVFQNSFRAVKRRDYAIPWLTQLKKQGFRVYYLSNYSEGMEERSKDCLDFLPYMDGGIFSYEVKCIKPEPEIFYALLSRHPEIVPEESVFFDDVAPNVEGAANLDFHAIIFKNKNQAETALGHLMRALG